MAANNLAVVGEIVDLAHLAMVLAEEEDEEREQVVRAIALVAVMEIMEVEEDGMFLEGGEASWEAISIDINDYHRMSDGVFKLHFRMSRAVFESVATTVKEHLIAKGRLRRERTPFFDIMLMVIWLLATPDSFRSVALKFGVRPSTLYYFYSYVIEALMELAERFITWPAEEERQQIKETFQRATGFPGVIGCIDCTHVYITAPLRDAQQYINRHHKYSINVQAVVDNKLQVRQLHVGEAGSMNDARVFRKSQLYQALISNEPGIVINRDEHIVGDGAYTLTDFMMKPFENNGHLNDRQLNFNRKLSQCRVRVENSFALAKGKWRRLKFLHARNPRNVVEHITASFVLHNMAISHGEMMMDEYELARPINNNQVLGHEDFNIDDHEDVDANEQELLEAAEARGEEKRLMIMNDILPDMEEE
ncbi:Protein ANTAGONIST OF LIKE HETEROCHROMATIN PROTEIN 1 [Frankliniella fusca]|uniref:Protein ANTAGONIST OF LIKE HETEROCHROMATIN PROTEIN 1 n=1 Tax=Frankliniella fusca TaxID=407009 RepID=A0AAE1HK45_9NEOP|nr:Protein ANTAGONIST OF LIKE HETEROCHROMATIN PROTEIN 1 [Frankliniella fusca]KAK3922371.1 Protein ANTAGONIST OF LIKE HETEROCHROMATIN PROTEIN 1 [Frankliniella fusca]KAK3922826.1 Protein ANTAGONIST OF LIKE HETEROCHROMATIN PROTEIN 1 [Frankliniella fusca]KAK3931996.1 Protein ANTAGONIST OF LIKE HETEROCHROMATIN PROTEIN 1 [Frankliniella fusca]